MNQKQLYAMKAYARKRLLKLVPDMQNWSGIYVWHRRGTDGRMYFYAGQSVHLVDRSVAHMMQYDHLGLSIRKRGLCTEKEGGWHLEYYYCDRSELDERERETIAAWIKSGGVPYNVTDGGQGTGKADITERKAAKGYMDGIKAGYQKARKEVAHLFEKNLTFSINGKPGVNKQKAYDKFVAFINVGDSTAPEEETDENETAE